MKGYCVKCRVKGGREMKNVKEVTMKGKGKTKRRAATGNCVVCGCKMYRILPSKKPRKE